MLYLGVFLILVRVCGAQKSFAWRKSDVVCFDLFFLRVSSNIYMLLGSIPVDDYLFEITVDYILSLPEAVDGCALKD